MATVGFVGLGVMGGPMAGHLLEHGHEVVVWNRTDSKADPLRDKGAVVAGTIESLAAQCPIVFLCVGRTEDVESCIARMTTHVAPGTLFIDHSTILPEGAVRLNRELAEKGFRFIDAPITGGSMGAQRGTLTVFCGGSPDDINEAAPIMSAYARRVERVGGPGAGQMTKVANQIAVGGSLLAMCEALGFAQKAGLDIVQIRDLLSGGAAGSWAFDNYGPKILARDWSPGFKVKDQLKDFMYCVESAKQVDAAVPGTELCNSLLSESLANGLGDKTTAVLFETLLAKGFES